MCGKCGKQSENHVKCQTCGNTLVPGPPPGLAQVRPQARPQIAAATTGPNSLLAKSFYGPAQSARSGRVDVVMNPPVRITRGTLLLPSNGRAAGFGPFSVKGPRGSKKQPAAKQNELNDPSKPSYAACGVWCVLVRERGVVGTEYLPLCSCYWASSPLKLWLWAEGVRLFLFLTGERDVGFLLVGILWKLNI